MSWLKLTSGYFYLMQGGSDQYIDRVKIEKTSSTDEKILGAIKEFPHEWFVSDIQRPKTIVVALDEEQKGESKHEAFTIVQLLKRFEVPVSYHFFENLKTSTKISELIKKFEDVVGTRFSDDFFLYRIKKTTDTDSDGNIIFSDGFLTHTISAEKTWNVVCKLKYTEDFKIENFPLNPVNPVDPDADEEEPSFLNILLEIIWNAGCSIKPYVMNDPSVDSKIVVELNIIRPKASLSPQRVTIATLEKAVIPKEFTREPGRKKVAEVLEQLSRERKITVNTPMTDNAEFNFTGQITFTDVMDTIALNLGAFWDWQGRDSAFLRKTISS